MRKTVIKSVIITLAASVAAIFTAICIVALAAPSFLGGVCSDAGLHKSAAVCFGRAYDNGGDIGNLARAVDEAEYAGDIGLVARYSEELVGKEGFAVFCTDKDAGSTNAISSYDYYCKLAVQSLYETGGKETAAKLGADMTKTYTHTGPLGVAIMLAVVHDDGEFASLVKREYERVASDISDPSGKLGEDIARLDSVGK